MTLARTLLPLSVLVLASCGGPLATVAPVEPEPEMEQAPAPEVREAPAEPAPPPVETAPEHLGTPASSKAAAPAWWLKWHLEKLLPEYAPQPYSNLKLFEEAGGDAREVPEIRDALLTCEIKVGVFFEKKGIQLFRPGAFSKADLQVAARMRPSSGPAGMVMIAQGEGDKNEMDFAIPLARMSKGDVLELTLVDREAYGYKAIEQLKVPFTGTVPLKHKGKNVTIECRLVSRKGLEAQLKARLKIADKELDELDAHYHPNLAGRSLVPEGGPGQFLAFRRHDVRSTAALVGWDDPRVVKRVQRLRVIEDRYNKELKQHLAAAREAATAPGDWTPMLDGEVECRMVKLVCGARKVRPYRRLLNFHHEREQLRKGGCVAHVMWRNAAGPEPIAFSFAYSSSNLGGRLEEFKILSADSYLEYAKVLGVVGKGGRVRKPKKDPQLGPGDTLEVAYMVPGRGPFLLQGAHQMRLLRLTRETWTALDRGKIQLKLSRLICGEELERDKKNYLYPMPGTKTVKDVGCAIQVDVRNTGATSLVVAGDPGMGEIKRLSLVTGNPVNVWLWPYASVSAGKTEKFPQGKGYRRSLSIPAGKTATILLAPNDDVRKAGVMGDSPSLLLQASFQKRRVDHLRVEPTPRAAPP